VISVRNWLCIGMLCLLLVSACGHSRTPVTGTPGGLGVTSTAGGAEPQWLTDALGELEVYERPADVNPRIFADLKTELARR